MTEEAVLVVDLLAVLDVLLERRGVVLLELAERVVAAPSMSIFWSWTVIAVGGAGCTVRAKNGGSTGTCALTYVRYAASAGSASSTTRSGSV